MKIASAIYYFALHVKGAGAFPPPLSAEREAELLKKSRNGDDGARNELIEHNLRLVAHIVKKYYNTGADQDDMISIGTIGLIKAVNTFCPDKNIKLATYASRCIENEILMYIRKNSHSKNDISLEEPLNGDWDGNELLLSDILGTDEDSVHSRIEKEEEKNIIRDAVSRLETRERTIIEMRFGFNDPKGREMTQKEVADRLGISQSYISRLEKKIILELKDRIAKFY